ncbi:hypothetical protein MPER_12056 [Moniliophthora perniciosa FA553]|nr:hypothetical protein MPER_12056 [Moniliophthora perniciosa FA553]
MQSRSLSFLSVLLLVFTQLTSALPNPAPKELVVRAAEAKAAAVNIAVRDNSPPPSPGNGRSGNGNDSHDNGRMRKIDDVGENDDFHNNDNNNDNNPPLPPGRNTCANKTTFIGGGTANGIVANKPGGTLTVPNFIIISQPKSWGNQ